MAEFLSDRLFAPAIFNDEGQPWDQERRLARALRDRGEVEVLSLGEDLAVRPEPNTGTGFLFGDSPKAAQPR